MSLASKVVDRERIERVLNLIEHAWKLHPDMSFRDMVERFGLRDSDEDFERALRDYLKLAFSRNRDDT